jgi:hypothetical protein
MAKNKTTETKASVAGFLTTIKDKNKRSDCSAIVDLITKHTGLEPKMWGSAIVGFGSYHYTYESGREGDAPLAAFSPRANAIVFYLSSEFDQRDQLLKKFGKHTTGKGCIYIQKLEDVDTSILAKMVKKTIEHRKKMHSGC